MPANKTGSCFNWFCFNSDNRGIMDQQELRELEYRCIQEEPPWCTADCPLHVDARALAGFIGQERWTDAWKVLRKRMPLPGILGRICDAPCESRCKRGEAGDAIHIGALERTSSAPMLSSISGGKMSAVSIGSPMNGAANR